MAGGALAVAVGVAVDDVAGVAFDDAWAERVDEDDVVVAVAATTADVLAAG